jgi:hypothetical protein
MKSLNINMSSRKKQLAETPVSANIKVRQTFCKENDVKIDLFSDEYFWDRMDLFKVTNKFLDFVGLLINRFNSSVEEYLDYRDKISRQIIDYLKDTPAYQDLNSCDMNSFFEGFQDYMNIPRGDIYKQCNIGKEYVSVDIRKANYVALVHYSNYKNYDTFNEFGYDFNKFMSQFTDIEYIQNNKRLREIIFGNLNGKRIATYEKYIIMTILDKIELMGNSLSGSIERINNDEFILNITNDNPIGLEEMLKCINKINNSPIPLKVQKYKLKSIPSLGVFIKEIDTSDEFDSSSLTYELACASKSTAVLATKAVNYIPIESGDLTFMGDLGPAIYLKTPDLTII